MKMKARWQNRLIINKINDQSKCNPMYERYQISVGTNHDIIDNESPWDIYVIKYKNTWIGNLNFNIRRFLDEFEANDHIVLTMRDISFISTLYDNIIKERFYKVTKYQQINK